MKNLYLLIALTTTACAGPRPTLPSGDTSANLDFISHSDRFPALSLTLRGKTYSVNRTLIQKGKQTAPVKKALSVPAGEALTLNYSALDITLASFTPVIRGEVTHSPFANPAIENRFDFEARDRQRRCSTQTTFTATANKNYTVFVEQAAGVACRIYVYEINLTPGTDSPSWTPVEG